MILRAGVGVPGASKKAKKSANLFAPVPVPVSSIRSYHQLPQFTSQSSSSSAATRTVVPPPTTRLAPPINYKVRGVMPQWELREQEREGLLAELDGAVNAPSTLVARESNFRIWTLYHLRWFGTETPVLPLTVDSIRAVAA